ncbi:MAG: hypothetical protein R2729_14325 [Bryobacteraceae bacterium]
MLLLRVLVGVTAGVYLGGLMLILLIGRGFDAFRSGAGGDDFLKLSLLAAAVVVLLGMLGAAIVPHRVLMRAVTALVVSALPAVALLDAEGLPALAPAAVIWLAYYGVATWRR